MKAKSFSSGGKVFFSTIESLRHLLGKGPGAVGSLLGKGVKKKNEIFPSLNPQPWNSSLEGQGPGIMGQRPVEKSKGVDLWFSASGVPFSIALSWGLKS